MQLARRLGQRMPIVGIAMDRFGSYKPSAFAGCRNTDFTSKFISLVSFSFTDTLKGRFMNTVHLVFVFLLLVIDPSPNMH